MINKKLTFVALAVMFLFMFSFTLVSALESANITIVTPASSGSLTGASALYNCSVIAGYESENYITGFIYLQSAGLTANTTEVLMDTVTNTTAYDFNGTLDSTTLEDGNDYTFKCSLWNGTSYVNTTRTSVTVNNGVPSTPTLSPVDLTSVTDTGTQTFTGTVGDSSTTSCTYTIYRAGSSSDGESGSGVYSGDSCTFTKAFSTTADNGVWWWTIIASDGTDTTSAMVKLNVNLPALGSGALPNVTIPSGDKNTTPWIIGVIVLLVVLALGIYYSKK